MPVVQNPSQLSHPRRMTTPEIDAKHLPGSMYCITAYFNPLGLASRYENFQIFYQRMMQHDVKMLCAEASLHERGYELPNIVNEEQLPVKVCSNHILWQKENLLSLLLKHLPDDCDKVCWVDSDILFQDADWQINIYEALQKYRIVQGYSLAGMLPKGVDFVDSIAIDSFPTRFDDCSKIYGYMCGLFNSKIQQGNGHAGFVWAARREILEEISFYNENILGGGDLLMARAATNHHYAPDICETYSRFQLVSYFQWAQKWCDAMGFSVGYVPNIIYHLFHGKMSNRNNVSRLQALQQLDYDPSRDLDMQDNGMWAPTAEGRRLLAPAKAFFTSRREDEF